METSPSPSLGNQKCILRLPQYTCIPIYHNNKMRDFYIILSWDLPVIGSWFLFDYPTLKSRAREYCVPIYHAAKMSFTSAIDWIIMAHFPEVDFLSIAKFTLQYSISWRLGRKGSGSAESILIKMDMNVSPCPSCRDQRTMGKYLSRGQYFSNE